jgi:proline racemase
VRLRHRLARRRARGDRRAEAGPDLVHESIVGSRFTARIAGELTADGHPAVVPEVTGTAYRTGRHHFELDPADDLGTGFVLR